jgi:post-segregation antitoxin (ccd killing protein)
MTRVNVYLPDDLAREARDAGLNVSGLTRDAVERALASRRANEWLDSVVRLGSTGVSHTQALEALDHGRTDMEKRGR